MIQAVTEEHTLHTPVMLEEVVGYLRPSPGKIMLDCTLGAGGHSRAILEKISPGGQLIAIDQDGEVLALARERLQNFPNKSLVQANFGSLDAVLKQLNIPAVDGILFDLGISSYQLDRPLRGFSFSKEGPLDMRMDQQRRITAFDLVNYLSEDELAYLLKKYGQERWHWRIARAIVKSRAGGLINSTTQLARLIAGLTPYSFRSGIHPATRTFQALRIAVNRELEVLTEALDKAVAVLKPGGRVCVISFHSLEDRIVKNKFRKFANDKLGRIITTKPLIPSAGEIARNARARSAKFRVLEKA